MRVPYLSFRNKPSLLVPAAIRFRPYVRLRIYGPSRFRTLWAVLDTGADLTVLPRYLADDIGISTNTAESRTARGVTGDPITVVAGEAELEIISGNERYRWSALVGFADFATPKDERAILGHVGFFDHFRVTFDNELREVEILPFE